MFAKKINLGDNFSSFDEFLNKYMDFVYVYGRPWDKVNAR